MPNPGSIITWSIISVIVGITLWSLYKRNFPQRMYHGSHDTTTGGDVETPKQVDEPTSTRTSSTTEKKKSEVKESPKSDSWPWWKWVLWVVLLGTILGVGWWWFNRPPPSYIVVAPPAPAWSQAVGARYGIKIHSDENVNVMFDDGRVIQGGVGPPTKWLKFQSREGRPVNVTVYP